MLTLLGLGFLPTWKDWGGGGEKFLEIEKNFWWRHPYVDCYDVIKMPQLKKLKVFEGFGWISQNQFNWFSPNLCHFNAILYKEVLEINVDF